MLPLALTAHRHPRPSRPPTPPPGLAESVCILGMLQAQIKGQPLSLAHPHKNPAAEPRGGWQALRKRLAKSLRARLQHNHHFPFSQLQGVGRGWLLPARATGGCVSCVEVHRKGGHGAPLCVRGCWVLQAATGSRFWGQPRDQAKCRVGAGREDLPLPTSHNPRGATRATPPEGDAPEGTPSGSQARIPTGSLKGQTAPPSENRERPIAPISAL